MNYSKGDTVTIEFEVVRLTEDENGSIVSLAPAGQEAWLNLPDDQLSAVAGEHRGGPDADHVLYLENKVKALEAELEQAKVPA